MFIHKTDLPTLPELKTINKGSGRWYITPNGNEYPSITTVLGAEEKPYLTNWRNMLGKEKADKEQKRCSDRGSAVHKMVEDYLNNRSHNDVIRGHELENVKLFNQIKPRLNKVNNIHFQEVALYSNLFKVAGRTDCIAEYDSILSVMDFKTANNNKTLEMIKDYILQGTFYAMAYEEMTGFMIEQLVIPVAVEKGLISQIFIHQITEENIKTLTERINTFYKGI